MPQGFMAWIQPVDGSHPDQGLPGGRPGRPARPDQGLPGFPGAPGHPGHHPSRPGRPTDPDYGVDEGEDNPEAGQLPVWPLDPEHPDVGLPPVPGQPLPPTDPPPGTVWPPLEIPGVPEGKAIVLAAIISSTGHKTMRYIVVDVPEGGPTDPDYGVDEGEQPEHPDQGLPSRPGQRPPQAGQPLPRPPGRPPTAGQLPSGGQRPPQAGQLPTRPGAPARPQPK
jgi:collagen type IV alpha